MSPRVGIIDSGIGSVMHRHVVVSRCFNNDLGNTPAGADEIGHGDQLARLILHQCPQAALLVAQIFQRHNHSPVNRAAEALDWLVEEGVTIVNMSFGLLTPSEHLAQACRRAAHEGVLLIASTPAMGGPAYPAALAECLAVTGDIRCAENEISWLDRSYAQIGACPLLIPGLPTMGGGSSFACARVTGIAASLHDGGRQPFAGWQEKLRNHARYLGSEVRTA
ncbi:Subtilisin BL [compost metagenome]